MDSIRHRTRLGLFALALLLPAAASATATYQFSVQPIIASGTQTDLARLDLDAQYVTAIFAQASIGVQFLAPIFDNSISNNLTNFFDYSFDTGGRTDLLPVWFLSTLFSGTGYRGMSFGSSAWVADIRAADTVAHELAHILTGYFASWQPDPNDLSHSLDPYNLLADGSIRYLPGSLANIGTVDQIKPVQVTAMVQAGHLVAANSAADAVPEPAAATSMGMGLVLVVALFRFRRLENAKIN